MSVAVSSSSAPAAQTATAEPVASARPKADKRPESSFNSTHFIRYCRDADWGDDSGFDPDIPYADVEDDAPIAALEAERRGKTLEELQAEAKANSIRLGVYNPGGGVPGWVCADAMRAAAKRMRRRGADSGGNGDE